MQFVILKCSDVFSVGNVTRFGQRSSSTVAETEKGEDSFLKWFLMLIPATTFCLGTWQVQARAWCLIYIYKHVQT